MADPSTYRPAPGTIPEAPGVYRFSDESGRVIYVGKAKSLRSRLNSYFADLAGLHPRTRRMVTSAAAVQWTVVGTEVEALQLEYNWIKEYDPRFNVRYRDDKTYPVLAVTLNEEYPQLKVYRGPRRKGVRYFGPYAHAWAIRETLKLLTRVFPARVCSPGVFKRHGQIGRPCMFGYIGKCAAPCVGRVSAEEHRAIVNDFCDFLAGHTDQLIGRIEKDMQAAAADMDFERAARLRDDAGALKRVVEKQAVVLGDGTDADVVAFALDPLEAAVQIFHVRGGRVRGQRGWVVERGEEDGLSDLVGQFLSQFYGEQAALAGSADDAVQPVPREVLVPAMPDDHVALTQWLSELRGSRVSLRTAQRGDKRALAETVERNAKEALTQHKLKRAGDLTARSAALEEIQEYLELDSAPLRIECTDVSHVQGSDVVASLVVFEDGLPEEVGLPALRHPGRRGGRGRRGDRRGRAPPLRPLPARDRRGRWGERSDGGPPHDRRPAPGRPPMVRRRAARSTRRRWTGRCPASTRRRAARASSPTRPTCSSSTAAPRRSRRPRRCSPSWGSPTSRCAAWRSGSRRCGCPARRRPRSSRGPRRRSTCCSGCATRPTGSRSPTTARSARRG